MCQLLDEQTAKSKTDQPLLVTLNPTIEPEADLVHGVYHYDHPVFDQKAIDGQKALKPCRARPGFISAGLGQAMVSMKMG